MKPVRSHSSSLSGFALFVVLLVVALVAVVLVQNGAGPLVAGGSVRSLVSTASSSVPPAIPAGISRVPSPTLPLVGSGDWVVTLPYSVNSSNLLKFGNSGQYVAFSNSIPSKSVSVYRTSDGTLLQSYAFPGANNFLMGVARDADVIGVTTTDTGSGCTPLHLSKFSSQQSTPIFSTTIGCSSANYPLFISPAGGIHMSNQFSTEFRRFSSTNTSGVPDAVITVPSLFTAVMSKDGHIMHLTDSSLGVNHIIYSSWTTPGTLLYSEVSSFPVLRYKAANYDGSHLFSCESTNNAVNNGTRLGFLSPNPSSTGSSDSYVRIPIDAWTGMPYYCDVIASSDDGKTVYLLASDTPYGSKTLHVYRSEDGFSYSRVSKWDTSLPISRGSNVTPSGSRMMYYSVLPPSGHGRASSVQIFDRGKDSPTFLIDIPGEAVQAADMSPDGSKLALLTCAPSASPCTTARLRVYDLSLIPTGVRAEYVSNPANRVRVRWGEVAGALSYSVFRGLSEDTASAQIVASGITATEWVDNQVVPGQTYHYWVKARDTLTHFFSKGAKVLIGNAVPALDPCPVEGAVFNANGTCTLTIPISIYGSGIISTAWGLSSWSDVQNAPSGTASLPTQYFGYIRSSNDNGSNYSGSRSFFHADIPLLSSVNLQSVQSVVLKTTVQSNDQEVFDSDSTINVVRSTQPNLNYNGLSGSDYSHVSLVPNEVYASLPLSSLSAGATASLPFTAAGKSALLASSGKPFTFALVEGHHLNGSPFPANPYEENTVAFTGAVWESNPGYLVMALEVVFTP